MTDDELQTLIDAANQARKETTITIGSLTPKQAQRIMDKYTIEHRATDLLYLALRGEIRILTQQLADATLTNRIHVEGVNRLLTRLEQVTGEKWPEFPITNTTH